MSERVNEIKEEYKRLTGQVFPPNTKLSIEELERIISIIRSQQHLYSSVFTTIPSLSVNAIDPRTKDVSFRKYLIEKLGASAIANRYSEFGMKKLNLVIDLDWTMVHSMIMQNDNPFIPHAKYTEDLMAKYLKYSPCQFQVSSLSFLAVARPHLRNLLRTLVEICNLYVYTSAKPDYASAVLRAFDLQQFFSNRVFAAGGVASTEKSLLVLQNVLQSELDLAGTLIFDDQKDVWRLEDQDSLIPSMRFVPLCEDDPEFQNNRNCRDKQDIYIYGKNVGGFQDLGRNFLENDGKQLKALCSLIKKVHKNLFVEGYTSSAVEEYQKLRKSTLTGQGFSLKQVAGKEENIREIIVQLGGTVDEEGPQSRNIVENEASLPSDLPVKQLLLDYFLVKHSSSPT